jgi:hypothetical protein
MVCTGPDIAGVKAGWKVLEEQFAKAIELAGGREDAEAIETVRAQLNRALITKVGDAMNKASAQSEGAQEISTGKTAWGNPKSSQGNPPASTSTTPKTAPGTKAKGTPFSAHASMVNNQAKTGKPFNDFTNAKGKIVKTTVKALFAAGKEVNRSDDHYVEVTVASTNSTYQAFYTATKVICAECKKSEVDGKKDSTSHQPRCYIRDQCSNCKLWGHSSSRCLHPTA